MFRTRKCKFILVCACIMAILLPYATPVLAVVKQATYKQSDLAIGATMVLKNTKEFENKHSYDYTESDGKTKHIYKVVSLDKEENRYFDYTNAIYCVDGEKIFPSEKGKDSLYKNLGDFFADSDTRSKELNTYIEKISEDNYKAICWLAENMYLQHQDDENYTLYNDFITKVYGEFIKATGAKLDTPVTVEQIQKAIDLDDIEAVQQYAIWYFSNEDYLKIEEDKNVKAKTGYTFENNMPTTDFLKVAYKMSGFDIMKDKESISQEGVRFDYLNMLFSYLITNAKAAIESDSETTVTVLPEIIETAAKVEVNGENYKIGPFEISEATDTNYTVTLTDGVNNLTDYTIKTLENSEEVEIELEEVVGKEFYIYIPTTVKISNVRLGLQYSGATTNASFWKKVDDSDSTKLDEAYQPLIWITKDVKEPQYKDVSIEESDLALRKFIVSVNGDKSLARKPVVDATGLIKENPDDTAIYIHKKSPIEISSGDRIVYEIRVYNEGNTSATIKEITDFIPEGLELVSAEESEINNTYKWTLVDGIAKIKLDETLSKIDPDEINANKNKLTGGLDSTAVQIELKVKDGLKADTVLTNVAEITDDNIFDKDSKTSSIKKEDIKPSFSGNVENDDDLDKDDYFYKGLEDDDDFEKVKVEGKVFDLALKKFISSVNGKKIDREPKVDVSTLSTTTNAKYTMDKTPLVVEQGDIITYTLRVYNEGDMDAFAEEIADYIPEGLGFIVNHKTNNDNHWSITETIEDGAKTVKLTSIKNAIKNVKLEDFENTTSLDDVEVVKGLAKIKSNRLSSEVSSLNLIKGFDVESDKKLNYNDVEVVCVVLAEESTNTNLKNIAEVTDDSTPDSNGDPTDVTDRDSEPDTVEPDGYPTDNEKKQDDHDYEDLTIEEYVFDLALQKFITAVDGEKVTDRAPTLTYENNSIRYNHASEPEEVGNGDLVEYTIRVYNEGTKAAYAAEVADDLPKGLKFVADNEVNVEYGWVLVDKFGEVTTDINQAKTVRTDYLSKTASEDRGEDCLLEAFDPTKPISTDPKNPNPDYRDVKIVFEVDESVIDKTTTTENRIIINTAEITEETNEFDEPVIDIDSTPDNWKDNEDDIDREQIYVKYFDLSLEKDLVKVIVIENGTTTEYSVSDDQLFKVEINKKKIKSTVVKFVYNITVKNEGEIDGYAKEIKDYIPEGLEFVSDDNTGWYKLSNNLIATDALSNTLLKANGGTASVQVTLKWINGENNLNKKVNIAEISKDDNEYGSPDIDSTPDNQVPDEDDIDNAPVILSISTGAGQTYYGLTAVIAVIMITGIILIKKFVL